MFGVLSFEKAHGGTPCACVGHFMVESAHLVQPRQLGGIAYIKPARQVGRANQWDMTGHGCADKAAFAWLYGANVRCVLL